MKCLTKVDHSRVIKILLINYIARAVVNNIFTQKEKTFFIFSFPPHAPANRNRRRQIKISRERQRRRRRRWAEWNSFRDGKCWTKRRWSSTHRLMNLRKGSQHPMVDEKAANLISTKHAPAWRSRQTVSPLHSTKMCLITTRYGRAREKCADVNLCKRWSTLRRPIPHLLFTERRIGRSYVEEKRPSSRSRISNE